VPTAAKERASEQADGHPSGDERFALLDKTMKRSRYAPDQLIEILHAGQGVFGYLSDDVLLYVARALKLPLSRVYGVATFYHLFSFEAPGDHSATVCTGTACFVKGADDIVQGLVQRFGVASGETTEDRRFTLKTARCLGSCGLAPVVVIDGAVRGHLDTDGVLSEVEAAMAADDANGIDALAPDNAAQEARV